MNHLSKVMCECGSTVWFEDEDGVICCNNCSAFAYVFRPKSILESATKNHIMTVNRLGWDLSFELTYVAEPTVSLLDMLWNS